MRPKIISNVLVDGIILASVREGEGRRQDAKVGQSLLKHFAPLTNLQKVLGKSNKVFFVVKGTANSWRSLFTSLGRRFSLQRSDPDFYLATALECSR